jgi:hypothetical protein
MFINYFTEYSIEEVFQEAANESQSEKIRECFTYIFKKVASSNGHSI